MVAPPLVLVIEDEPSIRELVVEALQAAGYRVAPAADGLEGLDMLRAVRPSAVLLDLSMPQLDGWQFLACYQHLTGGPLPIVVASANMTPALDQRLRALGVSACLTKPFDLWDLERSVGRVLAARRPAARSTGSLDQSRWGHLRELTEAVTRRLDASHALMIRAEDSIGWPRARILAYYAARGLPIEGVGEPKRRG